MADVQTATWHFFRRSPQKDLWCAVQAQRALPAFLFSGHWHYSGHERGESERPPGFDRLAADIGDHFNGFYLFQRLAKPSR